MDTPEPPATRARTASTPFGEGTVTAEVAVPAESRPGDELVAQRLDTPAGPLLRIAYRRADRVLRGPVSATPADLVGLRRAVLKVPALREVLPSSSRNTYKSQAS